MSQLFTYVLFTSIIWYFIANIFYGKTTWAIRASNPTTTTGKRGVFLSLGLILLFIFAFSVEVSKGNIIFNSKYLIISVFIGLPFGLMCSYLINKNYLSFAIALFLMVFLIALIFHWLPMLI